MKISRAVALIAVLASVSLQQAAAQPVDASGWPSTRPIVAVYCQQIIELRIQMYRHQYAIAAAYQRKREPDYYGKLCTAYQAAAETVDRLVKANKEHGGACGVRFEQSIRVLYRQGERRVWGRQHCDKARRGMTYDQDPRIDDGVEWPTGAWPPKPQFEW